MSITLEFDQHSFVPRPLISIDTVETTQDGNQNELYKIRKITLNGTAVGDCPSGLSIELDNIYQLYNTTGEFKFANQNTDIIKFDARVSDLKFDEDSNLVNFVNYSLILEELPTTGILFNTGELVSSTTNVLTLEPIQSDEKYGDIYKATQRIGAVGLDMKNPSAPLSSGLVANAKAYVDQILKEEVTPTKKFGFLDNEYAFFNIQAFDEFDEFAGSYNMTISWIMKDISEPEPYYNNEKITVNKNKDGQESIDVAGIFVGLSERSLFPTGIDLTSSGLELTFASGDYYQNAVSGYDNYDPNVSAQSYATGQNPPTTTRVVKSQVGHNPYQGTISYSFTYDNYPTSIITDAISDSLTITDKEPQPKIDTIRVLGRRQGPIVKASVIEYEVGVKTVSYEGIFPRDSGINPADQEHYPSGLKKYSFKQKTIEDINNKIESYKPTEGNVSIVEDKQDLNLTSNKVTRTITWHYAPCQ
jgi:hypothetical protein